MDDKLRKRLAFSLLVAVPVTLTGCSELLADEEQLTAYDECVYEMEMTGFELNCEDEESDWYKKKGYKSKLAKSPYYKSSSGKVGYGSSGYSSSS